MCICFASFIAYYIFIMIYHHLGAMTYKDRGALLLSKIIVGKIDQDLIAKYTVLAGTHCLLRYVENCSGTFLDSCRVSLFTP